MKKFKSVVIVAMAVMTVLFSACTKDEVVDPVQGDTTVTPPTEPVVGTGENGTRTWNELEDFSGIRVANSFDVSVISDADFYVKASGYENLLPYLNIFVEDNILVLDFMEGTYINNNIDMEVSISVIDQITNISDGDCNVVDPYNGIDMQLAVTGSGNINFSGITTLSGTLKATILGSGDIIMNGTVPTQDLTINGSGSISGMTSDNALINNYGSGDVSVNVNNTLNANIYGSGNVRYQGNPSISQHVYGTGSIIKID